MNQVRLRELMHEAILEGDASQPEDDGPRPKVGAILASTEGEILLRAHRGELGPGTHAEYCLLQKAQQTGIQLGHCILFVTLEPCTRRGVGKIPCAHRLVDAGIVRTYVGALDPNRDISGDGFLALQASGGRVNMFPDDLQERVRAQSAEFMAHYRHLHLPPTSPYVRFQIPELMSARLRELGVIASQLPLNWDVTITDLQAQLKGQADSATLDAARGWAYDRKYLTYDYATDCRGLRDQWIQDLTAVLTDLGIAGMSKLNVIDVGIGNGEVEWRVLESAHHLTLIDIAPESLRAASIRLGAATTKVMAAERLHSLDTGEFDLYLSFRTYQSTFFDLRSALREAHRLLRPGGSAVITVANGFVRDGSVVRGLVVPGTAYVDLDRPYELANEIRHHMAVLGFREPAIRSGADEIFVYGSRSVV